MSSNHTQVSLRRHAVHTDMSYVLCPDKISFFHTTILMSTSSTQTIFHLLQNVPKIISDVITQLSTARHSSHHQASSFRPSRQTGMLQSHPFPLFQLVLPTWSLHTACLPAEDSKSPFTVVSHGSCNQSQTVCQKVNLHTQCLKCSCPSHTVPEVFLFTHSVWSVPVLQLFKEEEFELGFWEHYARQPVH